MIRDILYALELGIKVIGAFILCIIIGMNLDNYLNTSPLFILIFIILAFVYVMKMLLGEIWR
jgi:F0F1-type ATP synthase assembly protein I